MGGRQGGDTRYRYRFGTAEFDELRFELKVAGLPVEAERKVLEVLQWLLQHAGEVVSKEELLQQVWAGRLTVDNVLTNAVAKLRRALGAANAPLLVTQSRVGYRLDGVTERSVISRAEAVLELSEAQPVAGRAGFVLRQVLGSSPAHEVWLAQHQRSGEQRVYKFCKEEQDLGPLRREASLYRLLSEHYEHSDAFVRIIDWNFEQRPFFLEIAYGGDNLLEWSQQPARWTAFDLEARLQLYLQIADAVAMAHAVGVLHKDIKPANVLIAAQAGGWKLRVTDFGSGRLLDPALLDELGITRAGFETAEGRALDLRSGTVLYVAPEVLLGQMPSAGNDVFALGVMLYQFVVGDFRKPLVNGWQADIDDPLLCEDIAAATEGNPQLRLRSVAELAQRLRSRAERRLEREREKQRQLQHLADQRAVERLRARQPWVFGTVISFALGLVVALVLYRQALSAQREASLQAQRATEVNRFLNEDLLGSADPSLPGTKSDPSLRDILQTAAAKLELRRQDAPELAASVSLTLGNAYFGLSDYPSAERFQRQALDLFTDTVGRGSSLTLEAVYRLARTLSNMRRADEALRLLDDADAELARLPHADPELKLMALWTRGGVSILQNRPEQALPLVEALDAERAALRADDLVWLVRAREDLAWCYAHLGRAADAERALLPLIERNDPPEVIGPLDWGKLRMTYANALLQLNRYIEAEHRFREVASEVSRVLGAQHFAHGVALSYLGAALQALDRWPEVLEVQLRAAAIMRASTGASSPQTLQSEADLAFSLYIDRPDAERRAGLMQASQRLDEGGARSPLAHVIRHAAAMAALDGGDCALATQLRGQIEPSALAAASLGRDWSALLDGLDARLALCQQPSAEAQAVLDDVLRRLDQARQPEWQMRWMRGELQAAD